MGRSKNACLSILTCAGAGGGGGDVAADPTNSATDANECHCEEGKVLSDKSRWSFRRRSTRHRVLRNNESTEAETVTNKENPNADQINDSNNICSPKYSSATDKTVEQEKPKENNIVVREMDEKLRENDVMIKESVKETHDESKENKESVKQTHDDSKENKESVKQTHDGSKENKETVKETHDKSKENKESFKETHDDSKENKESVKETYDESRENRESVQEPHDESKEILVVEEKEVKPEEDVVVKDVEMNLKQDNLSAIEDATNAPEKDENLEQAAVVIQSGFRGYRARKDTVVLKKVVKIQAVARGFLVRSKAVGTLRCLLAIMKMQAVVRLHQTPKKSDIITQGTGGVFSLGNRTCMSNDNLLLNGFAGKILDTMPKTKAIHIKCDPYKPDTTWQWLERWTYTISTSDGSQLPDQKEIIESKIGTIESNAEDSHADCSLPSDAPNSDSNFKSHNQNEKPEDDFSTAAIPEELNMDLTENGVHACELNNETSKKFPEHEIEHENNQSCENPGSDDLTETKLEESDVQKGGNKKAINPNFVAAQMKFQELSSNSNLSVGRSISNSKSFTIQADDASSKNDNNIKNHDAYNITPGGAMIKAVSECGTEISISSTLDSPDRSEIEGGEIVLEIGTLENKTYQNHTDSLTTKTQIEAETKNPDLEFQHEPTKEPKETITDSINTTTKSVEMERLLRTPEGTPISHATTTVTDLHGTPSSQSSVNTKRTKRERKKKPRGISTKRSLNSPISDSSNNNYGVIKRHGSIGHDGDSEPRISNSSLPSYMQATESARAKLHPSVSPKLSPDVSETNGNGKKRHSLPIASAKDSSPRMERSQSHQAQTNSKGNGTHSHGSSDKRWQI